MPTKTQSDYFLEGLPQEDNNPMWKLYQSSDYKPYYRTCPGCGAQLMDYGPYEAVCIVCVDKENEKTEQSS